MEIKPILINKPTDYSKLTIIGEWSVDDLRYLNKMKIDISYSGLSVFDEDLLIYPLEIYSRRIPGSSYDINGRYCIYIRSMEDHLVDRRLVDIIFKEIRNHPADIKISDNGFTPINFIDIDYLTTNLSYSLSDHIRNEGSYDDNELLNSTLRYPFNKILKFSNLGNDYFISLLNSRLVIKAKLDFSSYYRDKHLLTTSISNNKSNIILNINDYLRQIE